jgi:DNA-binding phage protein
MLPGNSVDIAGKNKMLKKLTTYDPAKDLTSEEAISENGNPILKTTIAVMKAFGIELTANAHV